MPHLRVYSHHRRPLFSAAEILLRNLRRRKNEIHIYVSNKYLFHKIVSTLSQRYAMTSQQRCVNFVYETTLPQLRCNVVVTLCVCWVITGIIISPKFENFSGIMFLVAPPPPPHANARQRLHRP